MKKAILILALGFGFFINTHALAITKGMCIIKSAASTNLSSPKSIIIRPNSKERECSKKQLISKKEYPIKYKKLKKLFDKYQEYGAPGGGKYFKGDTIKDIVKETHLYDRLFSN